MDLEQARVIQARESLEGAQALLEEGMDAGFILSCIFYAFYYAVLAVMNQGKTSEVLQSATIELFDRQFVKGGVFPREYSDALHRLFSVKPQCGGERTPVAGSEIKELLACAQKFVVAVEQYLREKQ